MPEQDVPIEAGKGKLVYDKKRRTIVAVSPNNEQLYFDTLKKIARSYQTSDQLRRTAQKDWGCDYEEALEMSYDNIQCEAELAIRGKRRPR